MIKIGNNMVSEATINELLKPEAVKARIAQMVAAKKGNAARNAAVAQRCRELYGKQN